MPGRSSAQRPGRPREADIDRRLATAVLALVRSGGPEAVNVESVAAASGVAKTTIYRRYANRTELLKTVLGNAIQAPERLAEGSVRDKIRFALGQAWRQMAEVLGPGGLSAIVLDADPQFTRLFRAALSPYEDVLVAEIREDVDKGLLRPDVDADGVVSLILGAYLGELIRRGRVDENWMERCLDMIWALLAPTRKR
jgi:AcrR family transcriptional regulator